MLYACEVPCSIFDLDPVCLDCRVLWFSSLILSENCGNNLGTSGRPGDVLSKVKWLPVTSKGIS